MTARLDFITPNFIVANLQTSVLFYTEKLGFETWYMGPGENPFFAMLRRGGISIMLKQIAPDILPVPNHTRHPWARLDAFVSTPEPDQLAEEFASRGVAFHQPLRNDEDGLRGFEIKDADGYVLFFGRPV